MEKREKKRGPVAFGPGEKRGECIILRKGEVLRDKVSNENRENTGGQNPGRKGRGKAVSQ